MKHFVLDKANMTSAQFNGEIEKINNEVRFYQEVKHANIVSFVEAIKMNEAEYYIVCEHNNSKIQCC